MKKILIANIFGIGDVLFTTPLISNLKKAVPGVIIDYICNARVKELIELDPDLNEVFVYEKDEYLELWEKSKIECMKKVFEFVSKIRKNKYDIVFDFTMSRKSGLFFVLGGIPRRIGLNYKRRGIFLTEKKILEGFEDRHVVEYYLDLLEFLSIPREENEMHITPDKSSVEWAICYLKQKGSKAAKVIAIVPGGGASWGNQAGRKRWSKEGFSKVADGLSALGYDVAILGDPKEKDLCQGVARSMNKKPLMVENELTLKQYTALLSQCDLVLCNDGGPLHIAASLGVKTVSIFGPVDERVYGPYLKSGMHGVVTASDTSCRPCYQRFKLPECEYKTKCLTSINPDKVTEACLELLEQREVKREE